MTRLAKRAVESTPDPLETYRAKRNFALTPEPAADGLEAPSAAEGLSFVVQKHWASHLHYDLRLELDGTMKSWAVPRGPSVDPSVKRMAVQVEDHPLAYAGFEGTVPARQYGAGEVIVWDTGTWIPLNDAHDGVRDGRLKFELQGQKLHGRWTLVRTKSRDDKPPAWLLIKDKDAHARPSAAYDVVEALPDSVKSPVSVAHWPAEAVPSALPAALAPQLATSAADPPPSPDDWLYEIKFDGYRMLVRNEAAGARFHTRHGHDWTSKLGALQTAFDSLGLPPGWYDGEIIVPGIAGLPDFAELQRAFDTQLTGDVVLVLFDVPYLAGHDLRGVPLHARRRVLKELLDARSHDQVRFSEAFDAAPLSLVASACKLGLEGIIAKRRDSRYRSTRSADWVKLKCSLRQEFVIGGYTDPLGSRTGFGALKLGVHDAQGVLRYAGDVGTGFSESLLRDLHKRLDAQQQTESPFAPGARISGKPHWVVPTLVAEISFGEWTRTGRIRHASFVGLRADKEAHAVVREKALRRPSMKGPSPNVPKPVPALPDRLQVTNPQRVIDARSGTTKVDMVRYYGLVGDLMFKHLSARPVSLLRAPQGVAGELFFQKHAGLANLPGVRQLNPALDPGHPPLIELVSPLGLLSAAQWNVLEFHTLNTGTTSITQPDRMVFDLDPGDGVSWVHVQEAAQLVRALLAELGLTAFLKTSGGKGLHLVVPLKRLHDWSTVKDFAQAVVAHIARTIPQRFVARSGPRNRVGKVFIDYLRNGLGATTVCAWSARARPGLGVSVPVTWDELPELRGGDHWSVKTIQERMDIGNAPWTGYARAARGLRDAMATLGFVPEPNLAPVPAPILASTPTPMPAPAPP